MSPDSSQPELDAELRAVAVPDGLLKRLGGLAAPGDDEIDAALRRVTLPPGLLPRLERMGRRCRQWDGVWRVAMAASLLMALGISGLGYLLLAAAAVWPGSRPPTASPPHLIAQWQGQETGTEPVDLGALVVSSQEDEGPAVVLPPAAAPRVALNPSRPARSSPVGEVERWVRQGLDPLVDVELNRWPTFSAPVEKLPELGRATALKPRGIPLPSVAAVDLAFFLRSGVHPYLWPAMHPVLQTSVVPLDVDRGSYEAVQRAVAQGQSPLPDSVRTEDFLAAMDYQFPRPTEESLGLHVCGGPSPFRSNALRLIQVGVRAGEVVRTSRNGIHLVLLVDVSASMESDGRLSAVRRALERSMGQLLPTDRVSLVAFGQQARVLAEGIDPTRAEPLRAAIGRLVPGGATSLTEGLRQAYALAYHRVRGVERPVHVVLLTDAVAEIEPQALARVRPRLVEGLANSIHFEVIEVGAPEQAIESPTLLQLAKAGGGRIRHAAHADRIGWALAEIVSGQSQLVAASAQLRVSFNPAAVACYRLLGHEARAVASLNPADPQADFFSGQSASGLYEVELRPKGEREVAIAELTWREPKSGTYRQLVRTLYREQIASSLAQSSLSLQSAAIAAETAEVLRRSPFVQVWPYWGSLPRVLEMTKLVDRRLEGQPAFVELRNLVQQLSDRDRPTGSHKRGVRR